MRKRLVPPWAAILVVAAGGTCARAAGPAGDAAEIHRRAIVVDGHSDTIWWVLDRGYDIGGRVPELQMDLPRMEAGGVDAQFFSIWPPPPYGPDGYVERSLQMIDALYGILERYPDRIELARGAADVERIAAAGKIAALMGVEGGHAIANDLGILRTYFRLGVRYMTLTWSFTHDWADSSADKGRWMGLTRFGEEVVREMNRLGMLVDVSHVSEDTLRDVLRVARAPVIASHSSVRSLSDHHRNLSDEMIAAIGRNGGVIQINFFSLFLDDRFRREAEARAREFEDETAEIGGRFLGDPVGLGAAEWDLHRRIHAGIEPPPLSRIVDHIDRVVEIAGIDHVGLGSDFDGVTSLPRGLEDCAKLPDLTRALLERGYPEADVRKILGGNVLRVLREAEAIARAGG